MTVRNSFNHCKVVICSLPRAFGSIVHTGREESSTSFFFPTFPTHIPGLLEYALPYRKVKQSGSGAKGNERDGVERIQCLRYRCANAAEESKKDKRPWSEHL